MQYIYRHEAQMLTTKCWLRLPFLRWRSQCFVISNNRGQNPNLVQIPISIIMSESGLLRAAPPAR